MSDYGMMQERVRVAAGRIAPQYVDVPAIYPAAGPPVAVGSVLQCTTGNWFGVPTSYAYAWKRDVATAIGSNSPTYTTVAGDSTHSITCVVSATNANGTTAAPASNAIAVP
jgi:hypothetical protein